MYKILKQRVSMSVLDLVLALDSLYSKLISAEKNQTKYIDAPLDPLAHIDEE